MSNKIARPATPSLDLLDSLAYEVYFPAGATKFASVNQRFSSNEDLVAAMALGENVADELEARKTASNVASPMQRHANKVASMINGAPNEAQIDAALNSRIDANPELSEKFAAAFAA